MGDVITVKKMKLVNESGEFVQDMNAKKNYMYDDFLQINLAAINRDQEQSDTKLSFINQ